MFQDMQKCRIEKRKFKPEHLIDVLLEAVGPTGTIVFPTYNWDFCRGKGFDIKKITKIYDEKNVEYDL